MSIAWKCPKCGVILRKGSPYLEKVIKSGSIVTGAATCANCKAQYSQHDVYSGKYDVPEPVSARQAVPEDPKAEVPELLLILIDREPPGGTALHLQKLLPELPLHERGRSQVAQVTKDYNNQFFISQAALLQSRLRGFEADLDKLTWRTYSTADGINGVFVKIYKSVKETAKQDVKSVMKAGVEKPQEGKRADIYEILMDAICCVMCADGKATPKEREAIHIILGKTKAPWTKEDIDKRIDGFLERVRIESMDKIVQTTCENLPDFKSKKRREVLTFCLEFIARADGMADENEKKLIEKFKSAVGIGATDSTVPSSQNGTSKSEGIVGSEESKEIHVTSSPSNTIEANKSSGPELSGESIDQCIDRLWESAKKLGWTGNDCEKKISVYTEILGIIDKSSKYNASASLHNRAICYRNLKKYDEALNDLQKELEVARKINDRWRIMECQKLMEQTRELKKNTQIKASGGAKAEKFQSMEHQASELFRDGPDGDAAFESLFADLQNADPGIRAEASKLLSDDRNAIKKLISIYRQCLNTDPRRSVLAGRVLGRKIDGGKQDMIHAQTAMIMFGLPVAFTPCVCGFCSKLNVGIPVPENGLYIGFYGQTDDKHGAYTLPVLCDYCGKGFFIAWDSDPR